VRPLGRLFRRTAVPRCPACGRLLEERLAVAAPDGLVRYWAHPVGAAPVARG